jgi:hypothetical protein
MYTNPPIRHCHHPEAAVVVEEDIMVVVVVEPSMVQHLAQRSPIYS